MLTQRDHGSNDVAHPSEAPSLEAVPEDRNRLRRQGLANESGHDHAILAGLSRPDRIEQPNDDGGQFFLTPVGHGQKLVNRLRAGVTPTAFVRRADQQVVFFSKRDLLALPIDLGGGSQEHLSALLGRHFEQQLGRPDVGLDGPHRRLDNEPNSNRGRQMEDHLTLIH